MTSHVAHPPTRRHPSVATLLAVGLLVLAVGSLVWVVHELAVGQVPAAFRDRTPYPRCPAITVPQGRSTPESLAQCLTTPAARRDGAEVEVRSVTTEGDPVVTHYRVSPGRGEVDVFTDASADRFGTDEWGWVRCPDVAALSTFADCWSPDTSRDTGA